jgi:hypothetical protein
MLTKISIRSLALVAILAIFGLSQAMASPVNTLPHSGSVALTDPVTPLPPFPPGTGSRIALADPVTPLPPFPPGTGSRIALADPVTPLPPFPPGTGRDLV